MTTRRHLFLDLEDTIISPVTEGWFNVRAVNVNKIENFIKEFKPDTLNIFSFAIWNDQELLRFNMGPRPKIEKLLGLPISSVPTCEDMIYAIKKVSNYHEEIDFKILTHVIGKQQAFRLCVEHVFGKTDLDVEVVLLDDIVYNEEFKWPDMKVTGRILNILEMKEPDGINQP